MRRTRAAMTPDERRAAQGNDTAARQHARTVMTPDERRAAQASNTAAHQRTRAARQPASVPIVLPQVPRVPIIPSFAGALEPLSINMHRVPTALELYQFSQSAELAVLRFLQMSGVYTGFKDLPDIDAVPGLRDRLNEPHWDVDDVPPEMQPLWRALGEPLSANVLGSCCNSYQRRVNHFMRLETCGVCGTREFEEVSVGKRFMYLKLAEPYMQCLRVTPDNGLDQYLALEDGLKMGWDVYTTLSGDIFYVIPEFVRRVVPVGSSVELEEVSACPECYTSLTQRRELPKYAIASGYHFGSPSRIGLPPLRIMERLLIAPSRPHSVIVKVAPRSGGGGSKATQQHRLHGHVITFLHNAPEVCANVLPSVDSLKTAISVQFVGPKGTWAKLDKAIFFNTFSVRPDVVYRWLRTLKAINNPFYQHIDIIESPAVLEQLQAIPQQLYDSVEIIESPMAIAINESVGQSAHGVRAEQQAPSDGSDDVETSAGDTSIPLLDNVLLLSEQQLNGAIDSTTRVSNMFQTMEQLFGVRSDGSHTDLNETSMPEGASAEHDGCVQESVVRDSAEVQVGDAPPALTTAPPALTTAPPALTTAPPALTTAPPALTTAPPALTTAPPAPPALTTAPPALTTAPPAQTTAPPAQATAPPVQTTAPPVQTTAPPAQTTAPPAQATAPPVQHLKVQRTDSPVNDYSQFGQVLMGSFPNVFFLGKGIGDAPISQRDCAHLMTYFDNRFANDPQLLFLLANRLMLSASAKSVSAQLKQHPDAIEELFKFYNDPSSKAKLQQAIASPSGPAAKEIMDGVGKYITICGRHVPYSPMERAHATAELYAMVMFFGMPSFFWTLSPDDSQHPLFIRLSFPTTSNTAFPSVAPDEFFAALHANDSKLFTTVDIPVDNQELLKMLAQNPVAAARVFKLVMEAVFEELIGITPTYMYKGGVPGLNMRDREGLFGFARALYAILEAQFRGSLHTHFAIWTRLTPELLQKVAAYPALRQRVADILDSIVKAELPTEWHAMNILRTRRVDIDRAAARKRQQSASMAVSDSNVTADPSATTEQAFSALHTVPVERPARFMSCNPLTATPQEFTQRVSFTVENCNLHVQHRHTCISDNPKIRTCRMVRPQSLSECTRVSSLVEFTAPPDVQAEKTRRWASRVMEVKEEDYTLGRDRDIQQLPIPKPDERCLYWELQRRQIPDDEIAAVSDISNPLPCDGSLRALLTNDLHAMSGGDYRKFRQLLAVRNGVVVEYSPGAAAVTGYNQALLLLGGSSQASGSMMYMSGYMSKNPLELAASLSSIYDAMENKQRYPSRAPDADTDADFRFVASRLQRTVNNCGKLAEMSEQQAAGLLLGMPANIKSHNFVYVFVYAAVAYVTGTDAKAGVSDSESDGDDADVDDSVTDGNSDAPSPHEGERGGDDACSAQLKRLQASVQCVEPGVNPGSARFVSPGGGKKRLPVPQQYNYAYRGEALAFMPLWAYSSVVSVVTIRSLSESQKESLGLLPPGPVHPGPKAGACYRFAADHVLFDTHVQRVSTVLPIPMLSGKPPRYPRDTDGPSVRRRFAAYMLTLFRPWDITTVGNVSLFSWEQFTAFVQELESKPTFYNCSLLQIMKNVAYGMQVNATHRRLIAEVRAESADPVNRAMLGRQGIKWEALSGAADNGDTAHASEDGDTSAFVKTLDVEVEKAIANVRERAEAAVGKVVDKSARLNLAKSHYLEQQGLQLAAVFGSVPLATEQQTHGGHGSLGDDVGVDLTNPVECTNRRELLMTRDKTVVNAVVSAAAEGPDSLSSDRPNRLPPSAVSGSGRGTVTASAQAPALNAEQAAFVQRVVEHVTRQQAGVVNEAMRVLLHGGPGTGKTTTLNALTAALKVQGVDVVQGSFTGVAATAIAGGRTLCALFHIGSGSTLKPLDGRRLAELRLLFVREEGVRVVLIIDEISMVSPCHLQFINLRLQQVLESNEPFGGLNVVFIGDFYQLPPVKAESLYHSVMANHFFTDFPALFKSSKDESDVAPKRVCARLANHNGANLFEGFLMCKLSVQMRAGGDPVHTAALNALRDPAVEFPITRSMLRSLHPLTAADVAADKRWRWATIIVASNMEKKSIDFQQAVRWAIAHGTCVVCWHLPIKSSTMELSEEDLEDVYRNPQALGVFVKDAPAMLTERNINPALGLANGSPCTLHSLCFSDDTDARDVEGVQHAISNAAVGEVVMLPPDMVPYAVNIRATPPSHSGTASSAACVNWPARGTLVSGDAIVPIVLSANDEWQPKQQKDSDAISFVLSTGAKVEVSFHQHNVDLAFAITFHKAQSKTMDLVILDLNPRSFSPAITFSTFFVGFSRVTHGKNLRIMPLQRDNNGKQVNLDYLLKRKPDALLAAWLRGFNDEGRWSSDCVRQWLVSSACGPRRQPSSKPQAGRATSRRVTTTKGLTSASAGFSSPPPAVRPTAVLMDSPKLVTVVPAIRRLEGVQGLFNFGNSCYINASVQALAAIGSFRECIISAQANAQRLDVLANVPVLSAFVNALNMAMGQHPIMASAQAQQAHCVGVMVGLYHAVVRGPARLVAMPFQQTADASEFIGRLVEDLRSDVASIARLVSVGGGIFERVAVPTWDLPPRFAHSSEVDTEALPMMHDDAKSRGWIVQSPLEELVFGCTLTCERVDACQEAQQRATCKAPYNTATEPPHAFSLAPSSVPFTITLPVAASGGTVTVADLFVHCMADEVLEGRSCPFCPANDPIGHNTFRGSGLAFLPRILMLRFVREQQLAGGAVERNNCPITCPAIILARDVVQPLLRNTDITVKHRYRLIAAIHHIPGGVGHYTADVYHSSRGSRSLDGAGPQGRWFRCNDDQVVEIASADTLASRT